MNDDIKIIQGIMNQLVKQNSGVTIAENKKIYKGKEDKWSVSQGLRENYIPFHPHASIIPHLH